MLQMLSPHGRVAACCDRNGQDARCPSATGETPVVPVGRAVLVVAATLVLSVAQAFTLVGPGARARVVVDPNLPACVWRAAQDLTNDVKKITGADLPLVRGAAVQPGDVHVAVKPDGRWEAYSVREQDGVLEVAGSDARGAMFGVYDFIERYLGVDPMYFWSGVPHPKRAELAWKMVEIAQGEPSFRFRGWFLNDEDLLTKWREASGVRDYSQYRYYHDVVNHGAMEAVAEALVRARMNLIIPASFLNATRPAEEGLAAICAARGVFVSMFRLHLQGLLETARTQPGIFLLQVPARGGGGVARPRDALGEVPERRVADRLARHGGPSDVGGRSHDAEGRRGTRAAHHGRAGAAARDPR